MNKKIIVAIFSLILVILVSCSALSTYYYTKKIVCYKQDYHKNTFEIILDHEGDRLLYYTSNTVDMNNDFYTKDKSIEEIKAVYRDIAKEDNATTNAKYEYTIEGRVVKARLTVDFVNRGSKPFSRLPTESVSGIVSNLKTYYAYTCK